MNQLIYRLHEFVTEKRRREIAATLLPETAEATGHSPGAFYGKEYLRMPRVLLPETNRLQDIGLKTALAGRVSKHVTVPEPLELEDLGDILSTLKTTAGNRRTYPSGGAFYPIETYVIVRRGSGLEPAAYHYHPKAHALEKLWNVPDQLNLFSGFNYWAEGARAIILFTGSWWKNAAKYEDFGYLLGVLETGHMAQNVLLAASALDMAACPLGGLNDHRAVELLDLDPYREQPVYAIALG